MSKGQEERLYFYAPGEQNRELTLGKPQKLNPYKYIPQGELQSVDKKKELSQQMTGKFVYDHLLTGQLPVKKKQINKPQKRKNYKTKMCPHGRDCLKKFTCTFAHNQYELRKPFLKRTVPCKQYQLGQCQLGAACREYHGNMDLKKKNYQYKTQICQDFLNGKCQKGIVCIHIHQIPSNLENQQENVQMQQEEQNQEKLSSKGQQKEQKPIPVYAGQVTSLKKKEIVQVIAAKIGKQQIIEDGLTFSFNFS